MPGWKWCEQNRAALGSAECVSARIQTDLSKGSAVHLCVCLCGGGGGGKQKYILRPFAPQRAGMCLQRIFIRVKWRLPVCGSEWDGQHPPVRRKSRPWAAAVGASRPPCLSGLGPRPPAAGASPDGGEKREGGRGFAKEESEWRRVECR